MALWLGTQEQAPRPGNRGACNTTAPTAIDTAAATGGTMIRVAALTIAVLAVLAGCGGTSEADIAACKTAMNTSSTGIVQWTQDKSTRPEACKKLDDKAFNKASTEWYAEFQKKLNEAAAN